MERRAGRERGIYKREMQRCRETETGTWTGSETATEIETATATDTETETGGGGVVMFGNRKRAREKRGGSEGKREGGQRDGLLSRDGRGGRDAWKS